MTMYRSVSLSISMRLKFCFRLLAFASLVSAHDVRNIPVQATLAQAVPASLITPAPVLHDDIFKRSIATCGFIRGNSGTYPFQKLMSKANERDSLTLDMSRELQLHYNCAPRAPIWMLQQHRVHRGLGDMQKLRTEGLHGKQSRRWVMFVYRGSDPAMVCSRPSLNASSILTRIPSSQEAPYCFRYARTSALGATNTYYSYACGTASADVLVLATATNGAAQTDASDPTGAGDNPLLTIPGVNLPTETGTGTNSMSNNPTTSKSPLSTTAIALIAVAGVVIISIVLFLGYWFCLRERKRKHEIVYPPAPPQLDYQQTVSGGAGPGSIYSWNSSVPSGANPHVAPSVVGSDLSGGTATETKRTMATVHEQPYEYAQRQY
jgi:hypothetical protein